MNIRRRWDVWQEVVRLVDGHRLDSAELYGVVDCVRNPLPV